MSDDEDPPPNYDELPNQMQETGEATGKMAGEGLGEHLEMGTGGSYVLGEIGGEIGGAAGWVGGTIMKGAHDLSGVFDGTNNDPYGGEQPPGGTPSDYLPEGGVGEDSPDGGA